MAFDEEPEYLGVPRTAARRAEPAAFEAAWAAGRGLSQADAVALALAD